MTQISQKRLRNDPELPRLRGSVREPRLMPRGDYDVQEYSFTLDQLLNFEGALDFGFPSSVPRSSLERHANMIFQKIKERDLQHVYNTAPRRKGFLASSTLASSATTFYPTLISLSKPTFSRFAGQCPEELIFTSTPVET
jgi:hypothetical protein